MRITKIKNSVFSLMLVSTFFTSCNGQTKTEPPSEKIIDQLSFTSKNTKLTKTQGTTEHQNVYCSLQDREGNIWFGTTGEGVYRYDGKEFIQFTKNDGLSNNSVWSILEDKSGNIWFGTSDGPCRYNAKSLVPVAINSYGIMNEQSDGYYNKWSTKKTVWSMMQDKNGIIWFGTGEGVFYYKDGIFTHFLDNKNIKRDDNLHLKMISRILEDKEGNIWFSSGMLPGNEGVHFYDGKSITSSKPNGDGWIRHMVKDKNETVWFGGRGKGNFYYDGKNFTNFTEKAGIGNPILADHSGNIWFCGEEKRSTVENEGGIWRYNGLTFKNYNTNNGLSKYSVTSMLEDINGNIWIGTRNCGLQRFDGKTFTTFSE